MKTSKKRLGMSSRLRTNASKQCAAERCHSNRDRFGRFCRLHQERFHLHGTPEGRRINPKEYEHERNLVEEFMGSNRNHKAIQGATWFLEDAIYENEYVHASLAQSLSHFSSNNISAHELIVETAALWLYYSRNPQKFDSDLAFTHALGTAALYLHPRKLIKTHKTPSGQKKYTYKRHSGVMRRELGIFLQKYLGVFYLNLIKGIEHNCNQIRKPMNMLCIPFV